MSPRALARVSGASGEDHDDVKSSSDVTTALDAFSCEITQGARRLLALPRVARKNSRRRVFVSRGVGFLVREFATPPTGISLRRKRA
jgi:hypothetical protein